MKRRRRLLSEGTWSDSLADIVSNMLGAVVILAACVGLIAALQNSPLTPRDAATPARAAAQTLTVAWPQASTKNTVFATVSGGRIQLLDLSPLYAQLAKQPNPRRLRPVDVEQSGVAIRFYPITNEVYCFGFRLRAGAGEAVGAAGNAGPAWQRALQRFPGSRYSYYFWVTPDSFEAFREVRRALQE